MRVPTDCYARSPRVYGGLQDLAYPFHDHTILVTHCGRICLATLADGFGEREAATQMVCHQRARAPGRRSTVGADKGYDSRAFVGLLRDLGTTPHVTQNLTRTGGSAIDRRTTRHAGYEQSQRVRPRIERAFGWLKTIAGIRKMKVRSLRKVDWRVVLASAAYNLLRVSKLRAQPASADWRFARGTRRRGHERRSLRRPRAARNRASNCLFQQAPNIGFFHSRSTSAASGRPWNNPESPPPKWRSQRDPTSIAQAEQ